MCHKGGYTQIRPWTQTRISPGSHTVREPARIPGSKLCVPLPRAPGALWMLDLCKASPSGLGGASGPVGFGFWLTVPLVLAPTTPSLSLPARKNCICRSQNTPHYFLALCSWICFLPLLAFSFFFFFFFLSECLFIL